jgi:hypothetical protein
MVGLGPKLAVIVFAYARTNNGLFELGYALNRYRFERDPQLLVG